jgi:hypothetical protein
MVERKVLRKDWRLIFVDKVNNPKHYTSHPSGIECIEIAEHHDFCIGNALKYLWRSGLKDGSAEIEDLKKAIWYIERKIKLLESDKK